MYTIFDYIKFYKDIDITDVKWNTADNLICSVLAYLVVPSFNYNMSLIDFYNYSLKYKADTNSLIVPKAYEILEMIKDSKRYFNLTVSNFVNLRDDNAQFGAATFRIKDNTIISYKGTDNSFIGWIENFRLMYEYSTYTQKLALKYLNDNIKFRDKNVYVIGHSKGGNLAMFACMETNKNIYNKIVNVVNFDGPGFMYEQFNSLKYKNMSNKLINIIPAGSMVGVLLENSNYNVVNSDGFAWLEHYPTSWHMFGEFFIDGELSLLSDELHKSTTDNIRNLDKNKLKETFETVFESLEKNYSSDIKFSYKDIINTFNNLKNVDSEVKKNMNLIISSLIKITRIQEK